MRWNWTVNSKQPRADRLICDALLKGQGHWAGDPQSLGISRSWLLKLIRQGHVRVNGNPVRASSALLPGQEVEIYLPETTPVIRDLPVRTEFPFEKIFEDDDLLVINKPQGVSAHSSTTDKSENVVDLLLAQGYELAPGIDNTPRPGIVHRLDKDTSGLLLIAKTAFALNHLMLQFQSKSITKKYWALSYGDLKSSPLRLESHLARNPRDRTKMISLDKDSPKSGRLAISEARRLEVFEYKKHRVASFLEVTILTGRTHQIRVHLTELGCSVLGDPKYGEPTSKQEKWVRLPPSIRNLVSLLPGQALHARELSLIHPRSEKPLVFSAEPPEMFITLLTALRKLS